MAAIRNRTLEQDAPELKPINQAFERARRFRTSA